MPLPVYNQPDNLLSVFKKKNSDATQTVLSLESMSRGWVREEFCRIFVWPQVDDGIEFIRGRGVASGFSQEEISRFIKTQMTDVMRKVVLI
jgi:hypothetical protein